MSLHVGLLNVSNSYHPNICSFLPSLLLIFPPFVSLCQHAISKLPWRYYNIRSVFFSMAVWVGASNSTPSYDHIHLKRSMFIFWQYFAMISIRGCKEWKSFPRFELSDCREKGQGSQKSQNSGISPMWGKAYTVPVWIQISWICFHELWRVQNFTSNSAIAEKPRCTMGQFWPKWKTMFCNHCNVIGLQTTTTTTTTTTTNIVWYYTVNCKHCLQVAADKRSFRSVIPLITVCNYAIIFAVVYLIRITDKHLYVYNTV